MSTAGAIRAAKAFVTLGMDESEFNAAARNLKRRMETLGQELTRVGVFIGGIGASLGAMFIPAVQAAAHFQETLNRFRQVFQALAPEAEKFGKALAVSVGRSETQIQDSLSNFQQFFVGLGFARDEAFKFSKTLTKAAIDFASFQDIPDAEADQRFLQALSGSGEVLAKFGVNVKESAINVELLNAGVRGGIRAATEQQKAVARTAIILKTLGSTGALGDAVRTQNSFQNQSKRLRANLYDLSITIGTALIPPLTTLIQKLNPIIDGFDMWIKENPTLVRSVAGLSAGLVAVGAATGIVAIALQAVTSVLALWVRLVKFLAFGGLPKLIKSISILTKGLRALAAASLAFILTPWGNLVALIAGVITGLVGVITLTRRWTREAEQAVTRVEQKVTRSRPLSRRTHDESFHRRPIPLREKTNEELIAERLGMRAAEDPDIQMRLQDPERYGREIGDRVIGELGDSFASFSGVEASRRIGRAAAAERTADATEMTAKNTGIIAKLLENAGPLLFAGN